MGIKVSIPKGTRDFGPEEMMRRMYIMRCIERTFQQYGFLPLETPSMERLSVLLNKYGEEGDQLIYRILNSGDFLQNTEKKDWEGGYKQVVSKIADKGLRYDLTVPFARYVVMHQNELAFPFRRYQMQPVWRGDAPQKGRYREFYQCDADIIGTDSLICEAEIILMINEVFENLNIQKYNIAINNRKIISGLTEVGGMEEFESSFCVALDKLDKIGKQKVVREFIDRGISHDAIQKIEPVFEFDGKIETLAVLLSSSQRGRKGIEEIESVIAISKQFSGKQAKDLHLKIDPTLARGLSYYTGCIFEVRSEEVQIGSLSGGGRYDNLTGAFGLPDMTGVGFSFGLDRIYDVMDALELFPGSVYSGTKIMFTNFDQEAEQFILPVLFLLRKKGIKSEIYPKAVKLKKQMNYANKKQIPFVALVGSDEIKKQCVTVKNMQSGEQMSFNVEELLEFLSQED